jgi:hypothetical protein
MAVGFAEGLERAARRNQERGTTTCVKRQCRQRDSKAEGCRSVAMGCCGDLMQSTAREAGAGKMAVDLSQAELQMYAW